MDAYITQPNEVVLFRGKVLVGDAKSFSDILLTNVNLVHVNKTKKIFSKDQVAVNVFPVENIKTYNNVPQIKHSNCKIEIFFTTSDVVINFESRPEARKFYIALYELVSGKSMSQLGADNVRGTINLVNSALGVDTINTIRNVMEKGVVGTILGGFGNTSRQKSSKGSMLKEAVSITQDLIDGNVSKETNLKNETASSISFDDQIETLKKYKELLDTGVISQEEFDIMKKQVMRL